MILYGDVSDDDRIDDGTECDGDYVEAREGVSVCAEDAMTYDSCRAEMDTPDSCFHRKGQDEVG
jgi:hypothetical protein